MKTKIIVVEDENLIALDIKFILEKEGYEVFINIDTVEKAIIAIEENNPELVLIDINLNKDKDGIDLANYLLEKDGIPYVFISSYVNKTILQRAQEARPYGYIIKPFKSSDIINTVSIVLHNFKHKNIDITRNNKKVIDPQIPFKIKQVISYINLHSAEKITIEELVTLTKWERRQFTRLFKEFLNMSPYNYIMQVRIEKAKAHLQDTQIPLNEIAYDIGFKSYSNFYQAFKKLNDETPESFRKRMS